MKEKVAITHCQEYSYDEIFKAIRTLRDNTDFPSVKGRTVLVKPNILSDSKPEKNITTNPLVVKAVINLLKEEGAAEIWVGDSPGMPGPSFRGQGCGIWEVVEETGALWADFSDRPVERTLWKGIRVPVARHYTDSDIVVDVSKMKTHQLMYATGAVKNLFGTIPGLNKSTMHLHARSPENFALFILSLFDLHRPEWSVMDAVVSMEGAGPANGTLRHTGLLLASSSALALDRAEAILMGYDPSDIPILREAERREKGSTAAAWTLLDPEKERIRNFRTVPLKKRGLLNSLLLPFLTRVFDRRMAEKRTAPSFLSDKCRRCSKCVDICPGKALTMGECGVSIDEKKCIRCYCCHEMCPFDAIALDEKED